MEIAARYSLPPNLYGYCGTSSFVNDFRSEKNLEEAFKSFHAYKYLDLIAKENGMKPFDEQIVRAFWIGNELLNISEDALRDFVENQLIPGNPERAKKLSEKLPKGILPHHTFNVLYVQFVTDSVPRTIENFDSCCVTSAEIISISGKKARVVRNSISFDKGFVFREKEEEIDIERNGFRFDDFEQGDTVSVHWGMAIEKLDRKNSDLLQKYSLINMNLCS